MSADLTCLLNDWAQQKNGALDRLVPAILPQLRQMARQNLQRERTSHTLQPTELVHEIFLKLTATQVVSFDSRGHFFALAARLAREVLVEHARARSRFKRGGDLQRVALHAVVDEISCRPSDPEKILAVHEGLLQLEARDARQSQVAELRFFAGLTMVEIAAVMGISLATAERFWRVARRRLALYLG